MKVEELFKEFTTQHIRKMFFINKRNQIKKLKPKLKSEKLDIEKIYYFLLIFIF